jgi:crotonobetainyl-CoA:carnitine CoA-transferase CaiB-like acyl-CoA transferase
LATHEWGAVEAGETGGATRSDSGVLGAGNGVTSGFQLPLSGVRVLDLTTFVFGPYATQILGDFGADVIKVEPPDGDLTRVIGPSRNPGMSAIYLGCNRNKRSIVLDLKREDARAALWRLIDGAEMFVHNIRPQKIAGLGFTPAAVLERNPRIVYGGLHGYREEGPYGGRPAYDDVIQGQSGIAALFTERDGAPQLVPSAIADKNAALIASSGLAAAYVQRLRTGMGLYVECSMFEGLVSYNLVENQYGAIFSPSEGEAGYPRTLSPHRRPHQTLDGYLCMLAFTDSQWRAFWKLAGSPEAADDPRFATMAERSRNISALYEVASKIIATRSTTEWLELFEKADVPAGPINSLADVRNDPHLNALEFFRPFEHPTEGPMEIPDTPYRFDGQSLPVRRGQPCLGEHGREVLAEIGMSEEDIDAALGDT